MTQISLLQITAITLTLLGSVLIYLTCKQQALLEKRLPAIFTLLGCLLLLSALLAWLEWLTTTAAIFTWLFTCTTLLTCIPFISLKKSGHHS